jgi:putative SOS response-associated peptidase YedK
MCGRFYLDVEQDKLIAQFGLKDAPPLVARFNIAPSQDIAAVRMGESGRELVMLHWGLIPFWAKEEKLAFSTINARADTAATKPAFREAFKHRRCLIPASGFFEWKAVKGGKQPYCIRGKDGELIGLAGLWEHWEDRESGKVVESCTILVTDANEAVRSIHERMPVILDPDDYDTWLDPTITDPLALNPLLRPWPNERTTLFTVSKRINNPRNDDPECIAPL